MPKITDAIKQKMAEMDVSGKISEASTWVYERLSKDLEYTRKHLQEDIDKKIAKLNQDLTKNLKDDFNNQLKDLHENITKNIQENEKQHAKATYDVVQASPQMDDFKQLAKQVASLSNKIDALDVRIKALE